jgi:chloramphenicol 3-O-phosphotransferase
MSASRQCRLVIVGGEEGAGKSSIIRALLPHTPRGARIDAEDVGQTNPCPMDDRFFDLLRRNVASLVENFWAAGYVNVVAGSFLRHHADYLAFGRLLTRPSAVFLVELLVDRQVREHRRTTRAKRTTQQWRDIVDLIPQDTTIRRATGAGYRYLGVDTTRLDIPETVARITAAIPEIYGPVASGAVASEPAARSSQAGTSSAW